MEASINFLPKTRTLRQFKLFESKEFFLLLGSDKCNQEIHAIKILKRSDSDRKSSYNLVDIIQEEPRTFYGDEIDDYFAQIGKTANINLNNVVQMAFGVLGFIRFKKGFYIILVTEKKKVAKIGRHNIYQIKDTKMVPLFKSTSNEHKETEAKYIKIFKDIQLHDGFYFSYTYDITHTLQENILLQVIKGNDNIEPVATEELNEDNGMTSSYSYNRSPGNKKSSQYYSSLNPLRPKDYYPWDEKFVWNYFLNEEFWKSVTKKKWILPITHGYITMSNLQNATKQLSLIIISRRSRHYAGTRYLKRGLNKEGKVANYVETEQIVYNHTASFDNKPVMSSFVQVRGSIPIFWTQEANPMNPKPDIILLKTNDSNYLSTKRHFAELFQRYSFPIICLNLTKEFNQRECKVSDEYKHVINEVINPELPKAIRIEKDFPYSLFGLIKKFLKQTKMFVSVKGIEDQSKSLITIQRGIIRTNCIDSLDRTNFAQEMTGFYVFLKQLRKLDIIKKKDISTFAPTFAPIVKLYNTMGDSISLQYGGSIAHHSSLNKKKNFIKNALPELLTSVKRHLANNFFDPARQSIINLFLGIYQPQDHDVDLWDQPKDGTTNKVKEQDQSLPKVQGKWWEFYLRKYEPQIPKQLAIDLDELFARKLDDSDYEEKENIISQAVLDGVSNNYSPNKSAVYSGLYSPFTPVTSGFGSRKKSQNYQLAMKRQNDAVINRFSDPGKAAEINNQITTPTKEVRNQIMFNEVLESHFDENQRENRNSVTLDIARGQNINPSSKIHQFGLKPKPTTHSFAFSSPRKFEVQQRAGSVLASRKNPLIFEDAEYEQDDDPFYELYNSHKISFIEKKLKNPFNQFKYIEFSKEELEDLIICHVKQPPYQIQQKQNDWKQQQYYEQMKKFVEPEQLVDKKEQDKFRDICEKSDHRLLKMGMINYKHFLQKHPELALKSSKWTRDIEQLYDEDDYQEMNDKFQVIDSLKSDLVVFENYANFDVQCLDSVRIKNTLDQGGDLLAPSVKFDTYDTKVDNPYMWAGQDNTLNSEYALSRKYEKELNQANEVLSLAYNDQRKYNRGFDRTRHNGLGVALNNNKFDTKRSKFTLVNNKYDLPELMQNNMTKQNSARLQKTSSLKLNSVPIDQLQKKQSQNNGYDNGGDNTNGANKYVYDGLKTRTDRVKEAKLDTKVTKIAQRDRVLDSYFDDLFGKK